MWRGHAARDRTAQVQPLKLTAVPSRSLDAPGAVSHPRAHPVSATGPIAAAHMFVLPQRWWMIRSPAGRAADNMALDEALMERARHADAGFLRTYAWSAPAISFGRNEVLRGRFDRAQLESSDFDLVRRPTGGRALLHVHEITYAVALPLHAGIAWRRAYDAVNHFLCAALRRLGVPAQVVDTASGTALPPVDALCFTAPAAGEIVVDGAKLVASAVWRDRNVFLQQGSILTQGDQEPLRNLAGAESLPLGAIATLAACGAPTDYDSVVNALHNTLAAQATVIDATADDELQRDAALRVNHFRDSSWLWRR